MLSEHGREPDLAAIRDVLEGADVLTVGFALLPERFVVDTRSREGEGPLLAIVEPVASVQERYLWLGKHRGGFGVPEAFSFFVWPQTVRSLVERDVLAPLRARLREVPSDADGALEASLEALLAREREAFREAVTGSDGWQTVWQRAGAAR